MKKRLYYDAILKDLFQHFRPTLLDELTGGVAVQEVLNAEFPIVQERRADLVLLLADGSILHIEFQSANHRYMPHRVGIYGLLAAMRYNRPLRQVVIYLGEGRMGMSNLLRVAGITVEYQLLDIRELDAGQMLASGRPGDCVLALLAGGGDKMIREIVQHASQLRGSDRDRVLMQLAALAGLRRLSNRLRMEYEAMGIAIDIEKNVILKDIWESGIEKGRVEGHAEGRVEGHAEGRVEGHAEGRVEGHAEGRVEGHAEGRVEAKVESLIGLLEAKFDRVPRWARDRVAKASPQRLDAWIRKILTADTIEGVIGKR